MPAALPDFTRLQPTPDSLNVLLKNTHFKDNLLDYGSGIELKILYEGNLPVLVFRFPEHYYDFPEVLNYNMFTGQRGWLGKTNIVITLILADPVITDKLATRSFELNAQESQQLRTRLDNQEKVENSQLQALTDHVYANLNNFLK